MFKMYVILGAILLHLQVNASAIEQKSENVNPYDLEDEVNEILQELRSLVRGQIYSAFTTIDGYVRDVYDARDASLQEARLAIQQEYETLDAQITTLKDLAQSAGQNVDVCIATNGPLLEELPGTIMDSLIECLAFSNREVTIIQNESRYRIDTLINEVNIFDFQIELCGGEILCLSPLITQIELAMVNIPQKIGIELQRASDLTDELKVLIRQCTDDKEAQFVTEGGIIANRITACINDLLP